MLRFITSLAFLISAHIAWAQDQPLAGGPPPFIGGAATPPTDLPSGVGNYCIYESLIYSIGSPMCIGKTGYVCTPNGFNERGYWTPKPADPTALVTPSCQ